MIRVGVVGASGLVGGYLLKFLASHPEVRLACLTSETGAGKKASDAHPNLRGLVDFPLVSYRRDEALASCDALFLAGSHGAGAKETGELVEAAGGRVRVIDLSGDYRLRDPGLYPKWYEVDHPFPALLSRAVYGLPEVNGDAIRSAVFVANPGCYATSIILALAPLLNHPDVDCSSVIADAHSGVSGAGRTPNERNLAIEVDSNLMPYKVGTHQHTPEIEQELSSRRGSKVEVLLVPHVAPFKNGILSTIYIPMRRPMSRAAALDVLSGFYAGRPFVRVFREEYPQIKWNEGTNFCDLGCEADPRGRTLVVMSVLDNMVKGAAGQAIQNLNLMFGLPEGTGLPFGARPDHS